MRTIIIIIPNNNNKNTNDNNKKTMFSIDERTAMIADAVKDYENVSIQKRRKRINKPFTNQTLYLFENTCLQI